MFWLAHGILVAYDQRWPHFVTKVQQMMVRKAAQHKANPPFLQAGGKRGNSLIQKTVMAQVSVGIERYRSEKDDARFAQQICSLHSDFKGRIIKCALRPLHPVDDAFAGEVRISGSTDSNTRI